MNVRKILLGGLLATAAIVGIAACLSAGNSSDHQTAGQPAAVVPHNDAEPATPAQRSAAKPAKPAQQYTTAQENAFGAAKDYLATSGFSLSTSHFSRSGLIEQLSSSYGDGYTVAQATYAADQVGL